MGAKLRAWIAAGVMGSVALASGWVAARLVPVEYGATGRMRVPGAVGRALESGWPDASQLNRWLAKSRLVRPDMRRLKDIDQQGSQLLIFTAQASSGEAAAAAVNQVLDAARVDLEGQGARFAEERHRALLTLLHHARADRARAQRLLDVHVAERLRTAAAAPAVSEPPAPRPAPAVPVMPRRNPLWDDLARQVGELEGRRAGLLQTMTEAHPVIRDLDWRLAQLREQLRMSQEFTVVPDANHVAPLPSIVAKAEAMRPAPGLTAAVDNRTLGELRNQLAASDRALAMAVQREREAWQELSALRAELQSSTTAAIAPLQPMDGRRREQIRWSAAIVGLGLAAATLRVLQPRRKLLKSTAEIHHQLGIPVLGKLSLR